MLIIFDLDGTLYRTEASVSAALSVLCSELSIPEVTRAEALKHAGKTTAGFLRAVLQLPESINPETVINRFRELERYYVRERGELYPGTQAMLCELKAQGHTLAVCSNGSLEYIELVTGVTGISAHFEYVKSNRLS